MFLTISILTAFVITFLLLPVVIRVSKSIDLLDIPDSRKVHSVSTPALGGLAIFSGFLLSVLIAVPLQEIAELKFFLFGVGLIFLLGIRDDVSSLQARHKLFIQLFAAFMVAYFTDLRLTGFYGILGIEQMPQWFNVTLTVFVIVALTNSFNLIDGIDGLAGSVGIFIMTFFGWVFLSAGEYAYAIVCLSIVGALIAFLFYNWFPSRVFMGDTGSMVLGFIASSLVIKFINTAPEVGFMYTSISSSVGIAVALMILPIFDTLRVFTIRFLNGKNPLDPDRNHLHHGLLKLGMNHAQSTLTLIAVNITIFSLAYYLDGFLKNGELLLALLAMALVFGAALDLSLLQRRSIGKAVEIPKEKQLYFPKSA